MKDLTKCLESEFTCYYHTDLIVEGFATSAKTRERLAKESAMRLSAAAGEQKHALQKLLREMSEDKQHPMHAIMFDATAINWAAREKYWDLCKVQLEKIANNIEDS